MVFMEDSGLTRLFGKMGNNILRPNWAWLGKARRGMVRLGKARQGKG